MINLHLIHRRLIGRATCDKDRTARLLPTARINNILGDSSRIRIGRHSVVAGELTLFAHGGKIEVGEWSFVGPGTRIWSSSSIKIGNRVMISHNVNIFDGLTHPRDAQARHNHFRTMMTTGHPKKLDLEEQPVTIMDDAWLGASCSVLRGVTIGEGAVVGAGAVVTRDVPAGATAVGNPARIIP